MKFLKFLIFFGIVISCYPSDEDLQRQDASRFEGDWIGSFDGDDKGNITFKVTSAGNFTGNIESTRFSFSEEFSGYVQSDGKLSANTRGGFVFNCQITNFANSTGNWTKKSGSETSNGTFKIKKK